MRYTRKSYFNLRPLEKYDLPVYVVTKLMHVRKHNNRHLVSNPSVIGQ